jgi:hypothetical protein
MTRQQAESKALGSGATYMAAISGFLNAGDQQKGFEEQRTIFCNMNLDTSSTSSSAFAYSKVVSAAFMSMLDECFKRQGFHAALVPGVTLDSFAIKMSYVGDGNTDIDVGEITSAPNVITCRKALPVVVHSGASIICDKPEEKTILVTINSDRGSLNPTTVYGKDTVIPDMQNEIKALIDKVAALETKLPPRFEQIPSPMGTGDACQIAQDFQICWGSQKYDVGPPYGEAKLNYIFASPFDHEPVVVVSPAGDLYHGYTVNKQAVTANGMDIVLNETRGSTASVTLLVSYMAIGKPKK